MTALNQIDGGMYGISLKPRLLRTIIKDKLPDEKHPFRETSELSHLASIVRTHRLLSESSSSEQPMDEKQNQEWKAAVDSWINRLLQLLSMDMPDKRWAGVCLLGVTCEECSSDRFMASYSLWFNKLLSHIQFQGESHFVMVASCASMTDLLTRLSGFSNVKKDGTSHAMKVIQPLLKLLNEDNSDTTKDAAISLLYTVITSFPVAVHRHYEGVEAAIVSNIFSGKCSVNLLKKLGHCLALLPKSKGDEDSWLLMMRKILISINVQLKDAFQGLEEESKSDEAMRALILPGNDPPPPLGGITMPVTSSQKSTKRPELLLMDTVSTLMNCCSTMLTCSYPVHISVPVRSLVILARRVLMLDGSASQNLYPLMTTMKQELICSELPVLHLQSLELLTAIVKGVHSQLLPHVAEIARLLTEYFRRCALPELRIKLYSVTRILLMSMGVGMSLYLTQEVIRNTYVDLDYSSYTGGDSYMNINLNVSHVPPHQPVKKKRKHAVTTDPHDEQPDRIGLEMMVPKTLTPMYVKIAALQTLETLLTMGGAIRSDSWRLEVDRLLVAIVMDACKGGWVKEDKNIFLSNGHTNAYSEFQLAALKALLASLISPGRVRPPFLSEGLELFRRGVQETGTKLSEFCSHALMTLEVLIHPRALPVNDFASDTSVMDGVKLRILGSGGQKLNTYLGGTSGRGDDDPESDEDDLYRSWMENDDVDVVETHTENNNISSIVAPFSSENPKFSVGEASAAEAPHISRQREVPSSVSRGIQEAIAVGNVIDKTGDNDDIMTEKQEFQNSLRQTVEAIAFEGEIFDAVSAGSMGVQRPSTVSATDITSTLRQNVPATEGFKYASDEKDLATPSSNLADDIGFLFEHKVESSDESIPDIVDEEPDTD